MLVASDNSPAVYMHPMMPVDHNWTLFGMANALGPVLTSSNPESKTKYFPLASLSRKRTNIATVLPFLYENLPKTQSQPAQG